MIQLGLIIATWAAAVLHFTITANSTAASFAPGLILFGVGMGLVMAQASNVTLSAVPVHQSGEASGVNNTLRQVGSSFGSAIIGAVLLTTVAGSLSKGITNSAVIPAQAKPAIAAKAAASVSDVELSGGGQSAKSTPPAIKEEMTRIAHQASADGARMSMIYTGLFIFIGFLLSFLLPNKLNLEGSHSGPKAAH